MKNPTALKVILPFLVLATFGAGCFQTVPSSPQGISTPRPTSTAIVATGKPLVRLNTLLGVRFPDEGLVVFEDSSVPKQEGALFYGSSYRITKSEEEYDRLLGRIQVLNLTDPYKGPRNLEEPMRLLLGCAGLEVNFGPSCELGKYTTTTMNGLEVQTYLLTYLPRKQNDDESFVTTTVWLIPTPGNSQAWLYVYPSRTKDVFSTSEIAEWMRALKRQ